MSDYPLPSYAAHIWTIGDKIVLRFPSPLDAPAHTVQFPNNEKGMALALSILKEREHSNNLLGSKGAPSEYQVERELANDKKYNEWIKQMQESSAERQKEKAEAEAFLAELGL
jgi:type IV secretory pathway VirB9-like protein